MSSLAGAAGLDERAIFHASPLRKREESATHSRVATRIPLLAQRAWMESGLGWRAGLDERAIFHASPKRERGTALRSLPLASTGHWQRRRVESLFQHAGVLPTDPLELLLCGWERTGGKVAGHRAADERVVGPERVPEP